MNNNLLKDLYHLNHLSLKRFMLKGLRRGSWYRLSRYEKGLFRCTLALTKKDERGLVKVTLMARLISIIFKLVTPVGLRLRTLGLAERDRLLKLYSIRRVFKWLPKLKDWIMDDENVFLLGVTASQNQYNGG